MDFEIPCAVIGRFAKILTIMTHDANEWFNSIRIDNGLALASNRTVLACEQIGGGGGIVHIKNDPALIAQCEKEAPFDSVLYVTLNEALRFASAKTTLGYIYPGNCAVFSNEPNDFDRWRSILPKPAKKPKGGMQWNTEQIALLGASSPSGRLCFEEIIDASQPTIVRDAHDDQWFGLFNPWLVEQNFIPATLPDWVKP